MVFKLMALSTVVALNTITLTFAINQSSGTLSTDSVTLAAKHAQKFPSWVLGHVDRIICLETSTSDKLTVIIRVFRGCLPTTSLATYPQITCI